MITKTVTMTMKNTMNLKKRTLKHKRPKAGRVFANANLLNGSKDFSTGSDLL
jgi:hypothetical protein